ncbi:EAL domain-containing protein [Leptolyngbya sp. PCC 6406]|uniref:bifunctional diguanylate cyclase/phosphodiesterase n=1 Tax=Leptolyngbya sp. PCC 6406 TaxID=1173264 RepID=UPI0002F29343|nr:EAL domain-containing protein [Leptolyngbya sp. PCC 6406]
MDNEDPLLAGQVSPAEWEQIPDRVKRLLTELLTKMDLVEQGNPLIPGPFMPGPFLDAAPMGIAVHDATGNLIYLNQMGQALLGRTCGLESNLNHLPELFQVYREDSQTLYPPEALPSTRALGGESIQVDDLEVHHPDRVIPLEVCARPIFDSHGQVIYAIATFQDISDRKRREVQYQATQNALRESEIRYRQVVQTQTDLILRSRPDTTITFANEALCFALGQPLDKVIGLKWDAFVPEDEVEEIHGKIAALTPDAPIFENINRDQRANQQIGWTQWISLGIFDSQGRLLEIQSVGRDVTALQEQVRREKALNRVFQAIRNSLDLETIFATATAETAQLLAPLDCFVVQYDSDQAVWRHVAEFRHDPHSPTTIGFTIADTDTPFAEHLKRFQVLRVEDISATEDEINCSVAEAMPGAWLLIPLAVEGKLWGSFSLNATQPAFRWQEDQVELAQFVAEQLEIAIQQSNLYHKVHLELVERRRVETALRESETRFRHLFESTPKIAVQGYNRHRQVIYWNQASELLYGYTREEACGQQLEDLIIPPQMRPAVIEAINRWLVEDEAIPADELNLMRKDGSTVAVYSSHLLLTNAAAEKELYCVDIDLRDRKRAETALRESEERYRLLAENIHDLVCLHDLDRRYLYVSPSCESLLGYCYGDMVGQDPYDFVHPEDRDRMVADCYGAALSGQPKPTTYRMRQKSGQYIWFETLTKPILNFQGQVVQLQTTSRDVTERIQAQAQIHHEALHDSLTGLPNRNLLMERLALALNRAHRSPNYRFAVLFLDLDRFKVINDSLGHLTGDLLLIAIAQRIRSILRSTDLAARLGGDEFVILLDEIQGIQEAVRATERIFAALRSPLEIEGRQVYSTASIGIVLGSGDYDQASHLLRDADTAMYRAKSQGRSRYEVFNAAMHAQALERLHLENDLRQAITRQELILHYQPIVALDTGYLVGLEALIRWHHPTQGLKLPGTFIPVAEETGLVSTLDYWALATACGQLAQWQAQFPHLADLKMSVNLSVQDLRRPDLLTEVDRVLGQTGLAGYCLVLEITESMLIDDVEATIVALEQLKERGVHITIDDFGIGYSSLSYLHRLPVDSLKVDRSFVQHIHTDKRNHQILATIMALGNQLELDVIAEGSETQEQLEHLQDLGYKFAQGHFFSHPLSGPATEVLLGHPGLKFPTPVSEE